MVAACQLAGTPGFTGLREGRNGTQRVPQDRGGRRGGVRSALCGECAGGDTVNVGHLVGICMSPLFYAQATGYFKDEGIDVQMKFMPNPGDALTALNGVMDVIHNPFTNAFVAAGQGAPVRIIAGSGAGGLFLVAQKELGIKTMADLAAAKGKGLKIGTVRFNTFELTLYRALVNPASATAITSRVVQRHAVDGGRVRGEDARSRHPRRTVRDAPDRSARRRAA